MEGYETVALQKEPYIAPFLERFKNSFFGKVFIWLLPVLGTIYLNIAFLSIICWWNIIVQGVLQKELCIGPFVEHFTTATLGWMLSLPGKIYLSIGFLLTFY